MLLQHLATGADRRQVDQVHQLVIVTRCGERSLNSLYMVYRPFKLYSVSHDYSFGSFGLSVITRALFAAKARSCNAIASSGEITPQLARQLA